MAMIEGDEYKPALEGWAECVIADIAAVNPKTQADESVVAGFVPMSHAPTDFMGALRFDEKQWGEVKKSYTNFKDGDVIFAKVTPCFENGKAALVEGLPNGIGAGSSEFYVLRPYSPEILPETLFFLIKGHRFMQEGAENMTGAVGLRRVPRAFVESFPVALPPLAEQKAIAEKLDTLLTQVESTKARLERIPKILKRFRQSVLAAAVSGKLTEEWREGRSLECISVLVDKVNSAKLGKLKVRVKKGWDEKINLYDLPESWAWTENYKLTKDESSAICAGPFGTIFKAKDFRGEGVPIIFLRHVKEEGFNQIKPNYMDEGVWREYHQEYSVFGGELLVAKLGDPPGESCIYPIGIGTAMVTPDVLKMSVDNIVVDSRYLMHFFNSPIAKKMVGDLAFGATRSRIDIAMFKNFPIPLPVVEEQDEIVRRVDQLFACADTIEAQVKNALERVNNLTQSILAKAFRGELTEQWRKDNPDLISGENSAEALLEKIKAERAAAKPVKPVKQGRKKA